MGVSDLYFHPPYSTKLLVLSRPCYEWNQNQPHPTQVSDKSRTRYKVPRKNAPYIVWSLLWPKASSRNLGFIIFRSFVAIPQFLWKHLQCLQGSGSPLQPGWALQEPGERCFRRRWRSNHGTVQQPALHGRRQLWLQQDIQWWLKIWRQHHAQQSRPTSRARSKSAFLVQRFLSQLLELSEHVNYYYVVFSCQ